MIMQISFILSDVFIRNKIKNYKGVNCDRRFFTVLIYLKNTL